MDITPLVSAAADALHHAVPFLPVAVALAAVYLGLNDVLDVALVVKKEGQKVQLADCVAALAADVSNKKAVSLAVGAASAAVAAGGDFRAAFGTALVAVAVANVSDVRNATLTKVKELLGSA